VIHVTLAQAAGWVAAGAGAWAIVRAATGMGVLRLKAPADCAACGRQKVQGRCPCTDD
jgi:hypothetical protein